MINLCLSAGIAALRHFLEIEMTIDELKEATLALPLSPGVYIMRDKANRVIYVGKAKKLKNRVSQYFQDTASHSLKTKMMVSKVDRFEVIIAASEFEALILECSLIKQHMPKYNILLKDDKGFPYLRLDMKEPYPRIKMVNRVENDNAEYFGPFGSRGVTNNVLQTIQTTLKLPNCTRKFPRDVGKGRPCLNYHMKQCAGWCQTDKTQNAYRATMEQVRQLLQGNYKAVSDSIKERMIAAASDLNFELAASLRNQLNAVEALSKKQLVTSCSMADVDVIGYAETETKACFAVLHFRDRNLLDKDYQVFSVPEDKEQAVSSLMKQYYLSRGYAPRLVLLPYSISDAELFSQLLLQQHNCKTTFYVPRRGDKAHLVSLAVKNAAEEAERVTLQDERTNAILTMLGKMLCIPLPRRIEAYDISNISGTDVVASMVVFQDGKARKSEFKRFKIKDLDKQDDYASMYQVLERRFSHYTAGDRGFDVTPDLLLIDGGITHAQTALKALAQFQLKLPVFGMVKDDKHRTRALVTPSGSEIRIDNQQGIFALIGAIQEETHRFAITYHRKLRSDRLKYSELDKIPGIGEKRKQLLLRTFKSLRGIASAELFELERLLPRKTALELFRHFNDKPAGEENECE